MDSGIAIAIFVAVSSLVFLLSVLTKDRTDPIEARRASATRKKRQTNVLDEREGLPNSTFYKIASVLLPMNEDRRERLGNRLVQAGLYKRNSVGFYIATKAGLIIVPVAAGLSISSLGILPTQYGLLFGLLVGIFGTIAPSFWLDAQANKRRTEVRRALPDALDVIIICLEGGLSLSASFERVARELRTAHPLLAAELRIVQREHQLGRSTGEALKRLAERFDFEELRSMAASILQAERFGASIVNALRVHAESLRAKRHQYAEEMAQKASVKLIFPTAIFIFPTLFVVLIGPASYEIMKMLELLKQG